MSSSNTHFQRVSDKRPLEEFIQQLYSSVSGTCKPAGSNYMAVMYAPNSPFADSAAWDKAQRLLASGLPGYPHVHPLHYQMVAKGGSETRSKTELAIELKLMQQPFKDAAVESAQLAAFDKILAYVAPELQTIIKTAIHGR